MSESAIDNTEALARFLQEGTRLLDSLDSRLGVADAAPNLAMRAGALREVSRIATTIAELAVALALDDVALLGQALAHAAVTSAETDTLSPVAAPGAHDTLAYLRWRLAAIRRARAIPALDENASVLCHSLEIMLAGIVTPDNGEPGSSVGGEGDLSELSPDERELIRNFATTELRSRDADIDAHQLSEAAAVMAREYAARLNGAAEQENTFHLSDTWHEFVKESEADLQQLSGAIAGIGRDPASTPAQLRVVKRIAHKIKGTAPTIGLPEVTQLASYLEWTAHEYQKRPDTEPDTIALALGQFLQLFDMALVATSAGAAPDAELVEVARRLYDSAAKAERSTPARERAASLDMEPLSGVERVTDPAEPVGARDVLLQVPSERVDEMLAHLSGLTVNRGALASAHARVISAQSDMARAILRLQEKSAYIVDAYQILGSSPTNVHSALSSKAPAWNASEDAHYTETDTALRSLNEAVTDVGALSAALSGTLAQLDQLIASQDIVIANIQHDATRMRLTPLADLIPRLEMLAKYVASTQRKRVRFTIQGEMTELDRTLMDALAEPLRQLVRNAVTHGIETPEERREAGKPEEGHVWIRAAYDGSEVVIEVGDDGSGINQDAIIARAITDEVIGVHDGRALSREDAFRLLFKLGFTLYERPNALAGGGIGLNEVATAVSNLKGEIAVVQSSEQGAIFQIRVPVTLTVLPTLELTVGSQTFTAPTNTCVGVIPNVGANLRLATDASGPNAHGDASAPLTPYRLLLNDAIFREQDSVDTNLPRGQEIPAYSLAECLGVASEQEPNAAFVTIRGGKYVALLVNAVGAPRETMVRPLPTYLRRRIIRGVTIRAENGAAAMLIDVSALADQLLAGNMRQTRPIPRHVEPERLIEQVLIVDDSITIRRALDNVLRGAGFATALASDGYEALELMENELPRVLILDVEMPRLNGYDLLRVVRGSPKYAHVRVAILTSRGGSLHEQRARELGADEYLVKPCPHDVLIGAVTRLFADSEHS